MKKKFIMYSGDKPCTHGCAEYDHCHGTYRDNNRVTERCKEIRLLNSLYKVCHTEERTLIRKCKRTFHNKSFFL